MSSNRFNAIALTIQVSLSSILIYGTHELNMFIMIPIIILFGLAMFHFGAANALHKSIEHRRGAGITDEF